MLQPRPISLFFFLLFTSLLVAQSPELITTANEVVVTGAKFARPTGDSPEPVTVIDSAAIARATNLSQLLNEQAGIVINGAYAQPGKDQSVFLRNGANAFTLILVDGQPLLDPSSLGGAVDLRLLSLDGIERIEILRGAKSLLYGSDAIAGVINLVTKQASANAASNRPVLHLRAAAQSLPALEAGVSVSGQSEKLGYRLGYDFFNSSGLSQAAELQGSNVDFADDNATRQNLSASLNYRPVNGLSIRPALRLASFDGDYDDGAFMDGNNTFENDLVAPSLAVDYDTKKTTTGLRYSSTRTERVFNETRFGTFNFNGLNQQADVYTSLRGKTGAYLTAGMQYRRESLIDTDAMRNNGLTRATTFSPYLQTGGRLGKSVLLEGGLRYNQHSEFGGLLNFSAAASLQLSQALRSRVSFSNGFQSPTIDQLGGPFGSNPDLDPQRATSLEFGLTLDDPKGIYQIGLSLFNRRITDLIIFDVTEPINVYKNRDELVDNGVELVAATKIGNNLSLNGNLTYVRGTLTQDGVSDSDSFFRRPRTTGMLGLTYAAKERFTARLSAQYTGERRDLLFDVNFVPSEVELNPYWLINAYAEYRLLEAENLRLFVDGINLTNADFVEAIGFSTLGTTLRFGASLRL